MALQKDYAVIITGHQKAELQAVDRDSRPLAADEIAGKTMASLISPGTETNSGYLATSGFPRGSGYSAVFRVEAIGSEVKDIQIGQDVFVMGNHRSYQRARRGSVIPLSDGLKPEKAVFARLMGVSMSTLTTTVARPPEKVMVMGLGIVGNLAAQNFANCGYEVMACELNEHRRNLAIKCGIKNVFSAAPVNDPNIAGKVGLVLDCSGHEQAVLDGCNLIRKRGEVVLIATPWQRYTEMYAHTLMHAIFHKYVVMRSGWEWELPMVNTDFRVNSIFGNLTTALEWLNAGKISVDVLGSKISPNEAQQAYQNLVNKHSEGLTYIFDWNALGN